MTSRDDRTAVPATVMIRQARRTAPRPTGLIEDEAQWRMRPPGAAAMPQAKLVATRWCALDERAREVRARTPGDGYVIGVALRRLNFRLSVAGRVLEDGTAMPGTLLVTAPTVEAQCLFRGPSEALHLHVPCAVVAECARDLLGRPERGLCPEALLSRDPVVERLGRALLGAEEIGAACGRVYVDSIGLAIVARLLAAAGAEAARPRKAAALVKWRLKRAFDHIEARLAEPVSLGDIAAAAGLTPMHFAAQFRAATGLRPHEYLLRRRIERAQELLVAAELPLVEVALSVGFQTQSHFTAVFKRFVGLPPQAWRRAHGAPPSCSPVRLYRPRASASPLPLAV